MFTLHYLDRAYERAGLAFESAGSFERDAYRKGKRAAQMPKREREYMSEKDGVGITSRYYKGRIFIYADEKCITMYNAPEWFGKRQKIGQSNCCNPRKRIRNRFDGLSFAC